MHLFICTTIFQLYMTKEIIKYEKIDQYLILYIGKPIERVIKYLNNSKLNHISISSIPFILLVAYKFRPYEKLYISSIDNRKIQLLCSILKFKSLISFDDGTANYSSSGYYFDECEKSLKARFLFTLLKSKYDNLEKIKKEITFHYAICDHKNIIDNVKVLPTMSFKQNKQTNKQTNKKIFICPYFDEFFNNPDENKKIFLSHKDDDCIIIPHPRDIKLNQKINNNIFVLEEYILSLLNDNWNIELYGYANTTQLIFSNVDNIKNILFITNDVKSQFNESYKNIIKVISSFQNTIMIDYQ